MTDKEFLQDREMIKRLVDMLFFQDFYHFDAALSFLKWSANDFAQKCADYCVPVDFKYYGNWLNLIAAAQQEEDEK
jgi:hypothetical protein